FLPVRGPWRRDTKDRDRGIAQHRERAAEAVLPMQGVLKTAFGGADLRVRFRRSVAVERQNPNRTAVLAAIIVARRADREVGDRIAVDVAEAGDRGSEVVILQLHVEAGAFAGRADEVAHAPVAREKEYPD